MKTAVTSVRYFDKTIVLLIENKDGENAWPGLTRLIDVETGFESLETRVALISGGLQELSAYSSPITILQHDAAELNLTSKLRSRV